jgi:acetylornithine deacetylase/succinyl-diaminopimelate desuccinylase-like protein
MKDMVAMELAVMLALARSGASRSRDVIFAALADEEAGGLFGALHWVRQRPELFGSTAGVAAAAINEVGGYSITLDGRRVYTIQVAEKGILWTRLRATGTPGHGSMPHDDNPAVKLASAVGRLAAAEQPVRVNEVVRGFFEALGLADALGADAAAILERRIEDPVLRRSLDAMLRDTVSPNMIHVGQKMNVIPGAGEAEIDVRTLPGTDQDAFLRQLATIAGDDVQVEAVMAMPPIEWPADAPIVTLMRSALGAADPEATTVPMMITPGTDAKALALLGIPTYGFAPLRLDPDVPFLSLFHGNDERVPVSALAFGLPVLADVVSRYAARA